MNLFKLCTFVCFACLCILCSRCSSAQGGSWQFSNGSYTLNYGGFPPSIGCSNSGAGCYDGPGNNTAAMTYTTHVVWSGYGNPSAPPVIYVNIRAQGSSVGGSGYTTTAKSDVTVKSPFNDLFIDGNCSGAGSYNNPNGDHVTGSYATDQTLTVNLNCTTTLVGTIPAGNNAMTANATVSFSL